MIWMTLVGLAAFFAYIFWKDGQPEKHRNSVSAAIIDLVSAKNSNRQSGSASIRVVLESYYKYATSLASSLNDQNRESRIPAIMAELENALIEIERSGNFAPLNSVIVESAMFFPLNESAKEILWEAAEKSRRERNYMKEPEAVPQKITSGVAASETIGKALFAFVWEPYQLSSTERKLVSEAKVDEEIYQFEVLMVRCFAVHLFLNVDLPKAASAVAEGARQEWERLWADHESKGGKKAEVVAFLRQRMAEYSSAFSADVSAPPDVVSLRYPSAFVDTLCVAGAPRPVELMASANIHLDHAHNVARELTETILRG